MNHSYIPFQFEFYILDCFSSFLLELFVKICLPFSIFFKLGTLLAFSEDKSGVQINNNNLKKKQMGEKSNYSLIY